MKKVCLFIFIFLCISFGTFFFIRDNRVSFPTLPFVAVEKRNFSVEVKTVGELEAAHSLVIASTIKGDQGKIIELIADGITVEPNQVLVRMDPTPFEEKIEKIKAQIKEQKACILALRQTWKWETNQVEHENKTAAYEVETAEMELEKIKYGDGPQEISRLKSAEQKARAKYEEFSSYSNDVTALQEQGFLNPVELKHAQKRLQEEKENYEMALLQYESYTKHVYPMQIKKAETMLKRAKIKQEEVTKTGTYKVAKAWAALKQAKQILEDYNHQLSEAMRELAQTEIIAPAPGMVVHREEYRSNQKRKPRVGDILVKNQPLMDLPDLRFIIVKTKVREVDLFKLGVGKKATIIVDAYPHLNFTGTILSIGVLALADFTRSNEEKYFEVCIALDQTNDCLRPGMTTRVTIHAYEAKNTLTVPIYAVIDERAKNYCYVMGPNGYEKRHIQIGWNNEQWLEVTEGLEEGELVCLMDPFIEQSL